MSHTVNDVAGDGNCFYTAIAACVCSDGDLREDLLLRNSLDPALPRAGVSGADADCSMRATDCIRGRVALELSTDTKVREWMRALCDLLRECPDILENYPFISSAGGMELVHTRDLHEILAQCAASIQTDRVWASEVENRIVRKLLRLHDLALVVVDASDIGDLRQTSNFEKLLVAALRHETRPRCIVLVRIDDDHYMYLTMQGVAILRTPALLDYMTGFVASWEPGSTRPRMNAVE
jgi:hypothetical protein